MEILALVILMTMVGFNFTKIDVERKKPAFGQVNIANNVNIANIEETDLAFGKPDEKGLKFSFKFDSKYEPDIGKIQLEGEIIYIDEDKKLKEIVKEWKKNKNVSKDIMTEVLNSILLKCNIEALILSKEINLPPPIPLPKVSEQTGQKK